MQSKLSTIFMPPELADLRQDSDELEGANLGGQTDRLRSLFFERQHQTHPDPALDKELVSLVLEHARRVIAHPSKPYLLKRDTFLRYPFAELAIEESLEEDPFLENPEDILVELAVEKPFSCVAILDASSSMSGEKHLLASIAVAVLMLQVPPKNTSLIVFASEAKKIKELSIEESPADTVLKFLRSKPRGFTNIARGLDEGLKQLKRFGGQKRKVGLIATDGRATEGKDPVELARQFDFLVVLHLHGPGSHLEASKEMAAQGHGVCLEVEKFEELPRRLYDAIRLLARL